MRLDSHQHFWKYDARDYPWIKAGSVLARDFLPPELAPLLKGAGLDGCIAVQARQTIEESHWLVELAKEFPFIRGVVGWVDLRALNVEEQLREITSDSKMVGVRHVVQDEPDDQFMLRPEFLRGISKLKAFELRYDILIYERQLPAAIELVRRFPEQPFVLDHLAKPAIRERSLMAWRENILEIARFENLSCKVSGMVTEAAWDSWGPHDLRPYLDVVFEVFQPHRLMFGSDWPVCNLAARYEQVYGIVSEYISHLSPEDREAVLGNTAENFYGLG